MEKNLFTAFRRWVKLKLHYYRFYHKLQTHWKLLELLNFLHIVTKFNKDKTIRVQLIISLKHLKESKGLITTANNDFFSKNNQVDSFQVDFTLCSIHLGICSKISCKI